MSFLADWSPGSVICLVLAVGIAGSMIVGAIKRKDNDN